MTTLFHMNSSAAEDEILSLQADIQLKSRAHAEQFLELTHGGKVSKHEEMCYLIDCIFWLDLFM